MLASFSCYWLLSLILFTCLEDVGEKKEGSKTMNCKDDFTSQKDKKKMSETKTKVIKYNIVEQPSMWLINHASK